MVKNMPAKTGDMGLIPGGEDPPEKELTTRSSILPSQSNGQRNLAGYSP